MIHSTQVHSSSQKLLEYLAGWQRARAELDNLKKRQLEDHDMSRQRITREIIESMLSLADNFKAMTNHVPDEIKDHAWTVGVMHIARQMDQLLDEYGVTPIESINLKFDPNQHEAVGRITDKSISTGLVAEVIQPGYMIGDQVIRPAKVKVAK